MPTFLPRFKDINDIKEKKSHMKRLIGLYRTGLLPKKVTIDDFKRIGMVKILIYLTQASASQELII